MELKTGDYVMYIPVGVCTVRGFEEKCFDGKTRRNYIELVPEAGAKTVCYLPEDMASSKLRFLRSAEEVTALLSEIPDIAPCEEAARGDRRNQFSEILRSDDSRLLISLVKRLAQNRTERENAGKHLSAGEETALKAAISLLCQEFAVALGITETEAEGRIYAGLAG